MTYAQAKAAEFNPFDLTKIWSHTDFPLTEVGRLVLDHNPKNYFAEVEQLAFSPLGPYVNTYLMEHCWNKVGKALRTSRLTSLAHLPDPEGPKYGPRGP